MTCFDMGLLRKIDRIHPYPAKFPVDMAIKYIEKYTQENDLVFDPFLGSGTTLLATSVLHRRGFGTDVNPIAILISNFKLLSMNDDDIVALNNFVVDFAENYQDYLSNTIPYSYASIDHWFCKDSILVLSCIKSRIAFLTNYNQRTFCNLVLSSIINTVSNQEGDTRYAAIEKTYLSTSFVVETFVKKFRTILSCYVEFNKLRGPIEKNEAYLCDAKESDKLVPYGCVDFILTSPPYPNTYDYYLYHKHRMLWLGYDVKSTMTSEIGSRREYSSLKLPKEKFNCDLLQIFEGCNRLLKPHGKVAIIMGDGKIQGEKYDAKINLINTLASLQWKVVDYSFSNLDDTSRSFQQSYRTKEKKEHVLVFEKEKSDENI